MNIPQHLACFTLLACARFVPLSVSRCCEGMTQCQKHGCAVAVTSMGSAFGRALQIASVSHWPGQGGLSSGTGEPSCLPAARLGQLKPGPAAIEAAVPQSWSTLFTQYWSVLRFHTLRLSQLCHAYLPTRASILHLSLPYRSLNLCLWLLLNCLWFNISLHRTSVGALLGA